MKAMILAAGEGKRLQPLTLKTPKPLLKVGPSSLIEDQINRLSKLGINEFVINISYLGEQIKQSLKNHSHFQNISFDILIIFQLNLSILFLILHFQVPFLDLS